MRHFDLADIAAKLRKRLGLRDEDICYLRYALRNMRREDFEPGRICSIWTSVTRLADELGLSVRQVSRIETRLAECGLIFRATMRNGRRFGRRGADGRIICASGINLAPFINRAGDLLGEVQQEAVEAMELRADRDRANDLIRQIRHLDAPDALDAARAAFPRLRPSELTSRGRLAEVIEALSTVLADFSAQSGRTVGVAPSDSLARPDTKEEKKIETCRRDEPAPRNATITSPEQVMLLASREFREAILFYTEGVSPGRPPCWQALTLASRDHAMSIGISGAQWAASCDLIGEARSVLCLLVADRNAARTGNFQVRDAASAFIGMTRAEARGKAVLRSLIGELMQFGKSEESRNAGYLWR
jgi:DNA-binding Lrp family transcriptional regulator